MCFKRCDTAGAAVCCMLLPFLSNVATTLQLQIWPCMAAHLFSYPIKGFSTLLYMFQATSTFLRRVPTEHCGPQLELQLPASTGRTCGAPSQSTSTLLTYLNSCSCCVWLHMGCVSQARQPQASKVHHLAPRVRELAALRERNPKTTQDRPKAAGERTPKKA